MYGTYTCFARTRSLALAGAACAALLTACADAEPLDPTDGAGPAIDDARLAMGGNAEIHADLATLRRVTARYHDIAAAEQDGFIPAFACQEFTEGALGVPYVHLDRLLDGVLNIEEPEVLFYEPQRTGRMRLVGVELVVPTALWTEPDPPVLLGQEFHLNEEEGLYGIHAWVWRHNPAGMFAFAHPLVTCEFAAAN